MPWHDSDRAVRPRSDLRRWRLLGGQTYTLRFQPREGGVALDAFRLTLVVPEPGTATTLLGAMGLMLVRRRRRA